ncbi:hypothetical protein QNI16_21780 [Cytophagaceae bacterium YF14B1]|uniref:Uncharacterized protein n=1 Tax=Xanthocytophaga flava TaxID=3048013 RepID=A0AAE3QV77_9BACT|nr:hypothetical protein [Xanthocytophaga flavus]MDJ1483143.1 hypothetical protein [Xanthocytophaga flavus]
MKSYKRTPTQEKIIGGMNQVYPKLIAYKKRMDSELVILKNDQIVKIKPE